MINVVNDRLQVEQPPNGWPINAKSEWQEYYNDPKIAFRSSIWIGWLPGMTPGLPVLHPNQSCRVEMFFWATQNDARPALIADNLGSNIYHAFQHKEGKIVAPNLHFNVKDTVSNGAEWSIIR